jgi:uncharacterized membrane protein
MRLKERTLILLLLAICVSVLSVVGITTLALLLLWPKTTVIEWILFVLMLGAVVYAFLFMMREAYRFWKGSLDTGPQTDVDDHSEVVADLTRAFSLRKQCKSDGLLREDKEAILLMLAVVFVLLTWPLTASLLMPIERIAQQSFLSYSCMCGLIIYWGWHKRTAYSRKWSE